jgi:DNA topoisomerase-1
MDEALNLLAEREARVGTKKKKKATKKKTAKKKTAAKKMAKKKTVKKKAVGEAAQPTSEEA